MVALGAAAALAGSPRQAAQQPTTAPPQTPPFHGAIQTVSIPVVVTDDSGRFVPDLTQADFEVRDDGVVRPITVFSREAQPLTAVLLLDGSASMLTALKVGIAEVDDFVVRLLPGDRARLGSFAEDVQFSPRFTADRDELLGVFSNEFNVRVGRRTRLWDAVDQAITLVEREEGRRVVIVFSDGVDTWSVKGYGEVLSHARRTNVSIYGVIMRNVESEGQRLEMQRGPDGSSPGQRRRDEPPFALQTMAEDTGGGAMFVNELDEVDAPFTRVSRELHSEYMLGFPPAALDGKVHTIDVHVDRDHVHVRARRSYLAGAGGQS